VMPLMSFHTAKPPGGEPLADMLLPADHGPGEAVVAGVLRRLLTRLQQLGGAIPASPRTGYTVPFDPEVFKSVALQLLDEAGVHFLLHAFADEIVRDGGRPAVVFETKSGPLVVRAQVVVDCTGDGDVAVRAGALHEVGRDPDGLVQPMTLMFRMVEFERDAFAGYVREHPEQWRGVHGLWDLVQKASAAGELDLPREDILFFATPHSAEISVNSTRISRPQGVLGTDVWDLTYAEWEGRRQLRQIEAFLRRYVPGFERAYAVQSGTQVGIRETRRVVGGYQLTADDILHARKFDDVVACSAYPIDIHSPKGQGTRLQRLPPGEAYDIPLRCLVPQGVDDLLVAGRCISTTHEALASCRIMPVAIATGHAAGVCAALAAKGGVQPREVPAVQVQRELARQGAILRCAGQP